MLFEDYTNMTKGVRARVKKDQKEQSKRNDRKVSTQVKKIENNDGVSAAAEMPTAQEFLRLLGLSEGVTNPSGNVVSAALCYLERTTDTLKVTPSNTVHPPCNDHFPFTRP